MILTQSHFDKFKVTGRKRAEFSSSLLFSYGKTLNVLTSQNECLHLRVCHDFNPMSFEQV